MSPKSITINKTADVVLLVLTRYIEQQAYKILKNKSLKHRAKVTVTLTMYYIQDGVLIGTNPTVKEDNAPFVINIDFTKRFLLSQKHKEAAITNIALKLCRGDANPHLVHGKVRLLSRKWELIP